MAAKARSSGPYRLIAERLPIAQSGRETPPIMMRAILESWCDLNCTGKWRTYEQPYVGVDFETEDDACLFMLSTEYGYIGSPPIKTLTIG